MKLCTAGTPYLYAPVAAFINGVLESDTAGVITGCLPQTEPGFMVNTAVLHIFPISSLSIYAKLNIF